MGGPIPPGEIPRIPSQEKRLEELLLDCYGSHEEGRAESVTVLGLSDAEDRRGLLLRVRSQSPTGEGRERRVAAEELWADEPGLNATVFDDYRCWVGHGGGLPDEEYE